MLAVTGEERRVCGTIPGYLSLMLLTARHMRLCRHRRQNAVGVVAPPLFVKGPREVPSRGVPSTQPPILTDESVRDYCRRWTNGS